MMQPAPQEWGAVRKNWRDRISIALTYPNSYQVGMSNLGFQTVYRMLNDYDSVACERVFSPGRGRPVSIESNRLLDAFDIVAFSLSFENDYANIPSLLQEGGVPFWSDRRDASHPLVIAGGVGTFLNPEPLAPFIDVFLIGEAEAIIPQLVQTLETGKDRDELLHDFAQNVPGAYVPRFYDPQFNDDGTSAGIRISDKAPKIVKRAYLPDLSKTPACSSLLTPDTTFDDTYLIEVSRGCAHGCRFCSASYAYRPVRFRPKSLLLECMEDGLEAGNKIGLVGAAVSDLPCLDELCELGEEKGVQLSFSSFRADNMSPELVKALARTKVKTATLAPEAGSQRMRDVIKKGLTEDHILNAAQILVEAGIPNLKLYFMIGLPTETRDDVEAIVDLAKKIKHNFLKASRPKGRIGSISISLNCFVPKPFTPFQWAAMDDQKTLKQKIKQIRKGLAKVPNVTLSTDVPRWAYIQALIARGDRKVSQILALAHENNGNWPQTFKQTPINPDFYVTRPRSIQEALPWDFIDNHTPKRLLTKEYDRALNPEKY